MFNIDPSRECVGWLIRHGELDRMSIWDSWGSYTLSEKGCEQAEAAARWLSYERIGRVIASDMPRSLQTAEYLMATGVVECPFLATDPNLRPWFVGDEFTGKEKTPERIKSFMKYVEDPSLVIPGGESRNQLDQRVQVAFTYLSTPYKALPTAIFIHNSTIKAIMGIDAVKDAVMPGGVIACYLDEKGEMSFEVKIGEISPEIGVS